ncbi:MAG: T9SS type A sorting domain-containing protein [Bacteroidales bacterium]
MIRINYSWLLLSVTEGYDNGSQNYRHVWIRTSPDAGTSWGTFYDMTGDLIYIFDECIVPSVSPTSDDYIYFTYQADTEPGLHIQGDEDPAGDNYTRVMSVYKPDIINSINQTKIVRNENVSQNYPNPFSGASTVFVMLDEPATLSFEVTNLMGQVVHRIAEKPYSTGKVEFTIDGSELTSGVYFYTVNSGDSKVTRKMIVE